MYGRQGDNSTNNTPPPPWLVRAEVTIRHPVTSSDQGTSSTITDANGVRMVYRWNTTQPNTVPIMSTTSTTATSAPSSSFGFQRGNITFTSTPPPRPTPVGSFTIPRSRQAAEDSFRSPATNVSDSGYNSEQFSPQSYSSLPSRRPSQQYNRRCKSTCSIVLSTVGLEDKDKKVEIDKSKENSRSSGSWQYRPAHQHAFPRYHFTTVPEVCEDCAEGSGSTGFTTHFCTRVTEKTVNKSTAISKDASSQTTDVESKSSSVLENIKARRKTDVGGNQGKQENQSPTPIHSPSSERPSESSTKDDSSKRKSRTVHIDVYCTGSDDNESTNTSTDSEPDTPMTVFESEDVKVTHTQATKDDLPRGYQDEKAFLKRNAERRCESFRHAPMRMPSLASSKGYESDDVMSSLYPSQFSSYSAIRDFDSAWSAASSSAAIPLDYESTIATSSKDTFSDIESLAAGTSNSRTSLTPCDSFEYANSSDRERIKRMEAIWAKAEQETHKNWRSPQIERRHLLQNRKMREYLEKHDIGWSSGESDSDESGAVGWSYKTPGVLKKDSTIRRTSKEAIKPTDKVLNDSSKEANQKQPQEDHSDSTTRSEHVLHPSTLRSYIGPFGSKSPSPLPSKVPSRVTSPFTTPQGEKTEHIAKASIFGPVIGAFRKPGHHIGPSKNPSCSCEHCRRYFEEMEASQAFRRTGNERRDRPTSSEH